MKHLPWKTFIATALMIGVLRADPDTKPAPEFPSAALLMADRVNTTEGEIAGLILQRSGAPAASAALLDLGIDLRIVQRWVLQQSSDAAPESDLQVQGTLRAAQLAVAATALEDQLKLAGSRPLTHTQSEAMVRLHQVTYNLPSFKDPKASDTNSTDAKPTIILDHICRDVGQAMLDILSSQPVDPRMAPMMRPTPVARNATAAGEPAREGNRTAEELTNDVLHSAMSLTLRQQLLSLGSQATAAAGDPGSDDAAALKKVFSDSVTLATGLASNTAIPQATREAIETQLAQGLALFSDPRMRSAGQARIEGLRQYRQIMARVNKLPLTEAQRASFAPAFGYAQNNLVQGAKVLSAIDQYLALSTTYDAIPRREPSVANLRKSTEDLRKQFETERDAFTTAAGQLSGGGAFSSGPDALVEDVDEMRRGLDLYETMYDVPTALEVLNIYKPRPYGGLEARALRSAITVSTTMSTAPAHIEAQKALVDMVRLARAAEALGAQRALGSDVPAAVAQTYAGGQLADFETKCRAMITELASQMAAGSDPDKAKFERLEACHDLQDALRAAAAYEAMLQNMTAFQRWADWSITPEQLRAVLAPYQQAMAGAFGGIINDQPDAVDAFVRAEKQYGPLVRFIIGHSVYVDACNALQVGFGGQAGQLMTPLEGQPFGTERYVGYAVMMWSAVLTDPDAAAVVNDAINQRLNREQHGNRRGDNQTFTPLRRPGAAAPAPGKSGFAP